MIKQSKVRAKIVSAGLVIAIVFIITHPLSANIKQINNNLKTAAK